MNEVMIERINNLIPIGTVLKLNGMDKKIMITTYVLQDEADYVGVLWPIGDYDKDTKFAFRTGDIEKIYFRGLEDEYFQLYKKALIEVAQNGDMPENANDVEVIEN